MSAPRLPAWSTPHGSALIAVLLVVLVVALCGCRGTDRPLAEPAPAAATVTTPAVAAVVADAAAQAQDFAGDSAMEQKEAVIAQVIPVVLDTQQAVVEALPPPAVRVAEAEPVSSPVSPAAVALIVRHEIVSRPYYDAKLQGFACPGDTSGPTVGIGSDLGVHTPTRIASDWSIHPHVGTLQLGSGQLGFGKCRAYRRAHADVRTPFDMAETVFATKMLPAYYDLAARAFRNGWEQLPPNARGALTATVFVRGAGMRDAKGSNKRAEMRELRDVCVPAGDVQCIARAHRDMCQRYEGRKDAAGLCKRFRETADLAVAA